MKKDKNDTMMVFWVFCGIMVLGISILVLGKIAEQNKDAQKMERIYKSM